jgi:ABC-type transporter Mla subunit MlaD
MRRLSLLATVIGIAGVVAAVVLVRRTTAAGAYRVAAVFDNAKGIVPGQDVKIAGAIVGTVSAVDVGMGGDGYKALIRMSVQPRFAPFRQDATCSILPDGLIAENYVECDPGHSPAPLARTGGMPTVGVQRTTLPVSLSDVLRVLSLPTDQRLRVLISELGIATSGRGQDLNQLLLRADPTLLDVRRALTVLASERHQLDDAVGQTDAVLNQLAAQAGQTRAFVDDAAATVEATAAHRTSLGTAVQRLPGLLDAADPDLHALDRAASGALPLLGELRASAPGLVRLTKLVPRFAGSAVPALRALSAAAAIGRPAVHAATPVVDRLASSVRPLGPLATSLYHLLVSTRDRGGFEGLLRVPYAVAAATSLYDNVSHLVTIVVNLSPGCIVGQHAGLDVRGCSHRYSAQGAGALPVNDPGCGPASPSWFEVHCSLVGAAADRSGKPRMLTPLLDYLLK